MCFVSPDTLFTSSYRLNRRIRHQSGQSHFMEARPSENRIILAYLAAKANCLLSSQASGTGFYLCAIAYPLSLRNPAILRLLQIHSIPLCHSLICSSAQAVLQNLLGTRVLFRLRGISEREAVRHDSAHEMGDWVRFRDGVPVDDSPDDSSGIPMTATAWRLGMTVTDPY